MTSSKFPMKPERPKNKEEIELARSIVYWPDPVKGPYLISKKTKENIENTWPEYFKREEEKNGN